MDVRGEGAGWFGGDFRGAEALVCRLDGFPLAARPSPPSASERVGVPGSASRGEHRPRAVGPQHDEFVVAPRRRPPRVPLAPEGARASTVHAASTVRPLRSPPFARYSVATRASSRTPPRADSAVTTSTPPAPPSRTAHAHSGAARGDDGSPRPRIRRDFVADGGRAREVQTRRAHARPRRTNARSRRCRRRGHRRHRRRRRGRARRGRRGGVWILRLRALVQGRQGIGIGPGHERGVARAGRGERGEVSPANGVVRRGGREVVPATDRPAPRAGLRGTKGRRGEAGDVGFSDGASR